MRTVVALGVGTYNPCRQVEHIWMDEVRYQIWGMVRSRVWSDLGYEILYVVCRDTCSCMLTVITLWRRYIQPHAVRTEHIRMEEIP
jgi:hypothetical protein